MTTFWERVKTGGKTGFDKAWKTVDKLGAPVNKLSNRLGSEAFWPTTLDKESDKAARILKSFCRDGFYAEEERQPEDGPKQRQKVIKKIPSSVIKNAKGLAIFTTMRTGLWMSGAGGSGILIAQKEDGTWSPPSGILLHTAGLGFMVGIDIYDCVVVINTQEALEAFYKIRCTLGSEISVAAGPVGAGGVIDTEVHKRRAPIFTYMKSRGFYAGVQIDGTIVLERTDENERFYGQRIGTKDILAGKVQHPPFEIKRLLETIKAAQGDTNVDESVLPSEPPPGDLELDDGHIFGLPDKEDPDPYGVLALEKEGMRVVEASTKERASWEQFSFNPSPTSPVHDMYARDLPGSRRSSWRTSMASANGHANSRARPSSLRRSVDHSVRTPTTTMANSSTQTDFPVEPQSQGIASWRNGISRRSSEANSIQRQMQGVPEHGVLESPTQLRTIDVAINKATGYTTPPSTPPHSEIHHPTNLVDELKEEASADKNKHGDKDEDEDDDGHDADPEDEAEIVSPVVHSVQTMTPASTQVVSKARLVTVAKRIPPKLPPRNPDRAALSGSPVSKFSEDLSLSPTHETEAIAGRISPEIDEKKENKIDDVQQPMFEISLDDQEGKAAGNRTSTSSTWSKVQEMRLDESDEDDEKKVPGGF